MELRVRRLGREKQEKVAESPDGTFATYVYCSTALYTKNSQDGRCVRFSIWGPTILVYAINDSAQRNYVYEAQAGRKQEMVADSPDGSLATFAYYNGSTDGFKLGNLRHAVRSH